MKRSKGWTIKVTKIPSNVNNYGGSRKAKDVIVKSVDRCKIAWSVGTPAPGVKYNNANTISIELCAIAQKEPTQAQIKSCNELIKFIKKRHKNCKEVIRHYDVNGKLCPALYVDNAKWKELKKEITK